MEGRLGKYELLERLAIGGMAELFLARSSAQHGFEKTVVLKRILPSYAEQADFVQMFLNEARLAAGLHHPNIAQVFDFGEDDGDFFFTMEYVAGRNVRQLVGASQRVSIPLALGCALYIIENVAAGLHHAHEHRDADGTPLQIVHRDVSPSNVIVTYEGNVKLVDFGVAKIAALGPSTLAGSLKGKVSYMSPEQCRGELVDRRSDIFSLGTLLWELTTGRRLFGDSSGLALLKRVEAADVPRPTSLVPNYPPDLEEIVLKALAREREDRFPTALDFRVAIEDFVYQHRIPLTSTRLSAYMDSLFPADGRQSASMMGALPLVRNSSSFPKANRGAPKPVPRIASQPYTVPVSPLETVVEAGPSRPQLTMHDGDPDPEEPKTLVAAGPNDPEETSPAQLEEEEHEHAVLEPRRDRSAGWLIWFGVATVAVGVVGGVSWRSMKNAEVSAAQRSAPAVEAQPPQVPAEMIEEEPASPPLPETLDELRALSYAERHARLATTEGTVAVDLHVGLDLVQAADAENPCRTFADALNTIEASDSLEDFRWALDEAIPPEGQGEGQGSTCKGLDERLATLRGDEDESKSAKSRRGGRTRKPPRPTSKVEEPPKPVPEPEPEPEVIPVPPPKPEPSPSVATKLDEDLRGMNR